MKDGGGGGKESLSMRKFVIGVKLVQSATRGALPLESALSLPPGGSPLRIGSQSATRGLSPCSSTCRRVTTVSPRLNRSSGSGGGGRPV